MKQLLQRFDSGELRLLDVPVPAASSAGLVVASRASLISPGTERMIVELGRASLLQKARSRPDQVRQVLEKVRTDGVASTAGAVRSRLEAPNALGYCNAGVVVEAGAAVRRFGVGDRVVTNGPHSEFVRVAHTLAARIPVNVDFDAAAFTPLAAIALQGIRLAAPTLGETVVVYGLGPIGLLAVQLLRLNGCAVIGIDTDSDRLELASRFGAVAVPGGAAAVDTVLRRTDGHGADAVLLTLASSSDEPVHHAAAMSRKRGRIVLVGVTGLQLRRDDFYRKELSFAVSCSYGPGRYDPVYEDDGQDYPLGFVRWTAQRNFDAVLGLMAAGSLDIAPLLTHRFPFERAVDAYDLITSSAPSLGVLLEYPHRELTSIGAEARTVAVSGREIVKRAGPGSAVVIGAGAYAQRILVPAIADAGFRLRAVASGKGTSAAVTADRFSFEVATTDLDAALLDRDADTIFILTRHDTHAALAMRALQVGRNVFVEKPLALTPSDLDAIEAAERESSGMLMVGFNRRFAPLTRELMSLLENRSGPLAVVATVNAGAVPRDHWTQHPLQGGGRIAGEACHFIDLCRALVGARIVTGQAVSAGEPAGGVVDDVCTMTLGFADGSIAAIHYLASGARSFPKERIEVFVDGATYVIDNWRRLRSYGGRRPRRGGLFGKGQDKGQRDQLRTWFRAVQAGGPPPVPIDEVLEVSRWTLDLAEQARRLRGASGGINAPADPQV